MEPLLQKILGNWHVISTLQKDEKLIVHPDGRLSKDPYTVVQFLGRRIFGRGLQATHDGLTYLWDITSALTELLLNHEALNQVRYYALSDLKDIERSAYKEKTVQIRTLLEHLKSARDKGLRNLIETYNKDCKLEQLAQSIDFLIGKADLKLVHLKKCESRQEKKKVAPPPSSSHRHHSNKLFESDEETETDSDSEKPQSKVSQKHSPKHSGKH